MADRGASNQITAVGASHAPRPILAQERTRLARQAGPSTGVGVGADRARGALPSLIVQVATNAYRLLALAVLLVEGEPILALVAQACSLVLAIAHRTLDAFAQVGLGVERVIIRADPAQTRSVGAGAGNAFGLFQDGSLGRAGDIGHVRVVLAGVAGGIPEFVLVACLAPVE